MVMVPISFNDASKGLNSDASDTAPWLWPRVSQRLRPASSGLASLPPARIPDGVAGLWTEDLMSPEKMPDDFARYTCLSNPRVISRASRSENALASTGLSPSSTRASS